MRMEFRFGKDASKQFIENKLKWDSKSYIKIAKKFAKYSDLKQKSCYVCGGKKAKKVCSFYGINYLKCLKCSHIFADRRPSQKILTKYYTYDIDYSSNAYANKKLLKLREELFIPKIKFIKKFVKGEKWLDVGSADGASTAVIMKEGYNCTGIEISEHSRRFAKKFRGLDLYPNSLDKFVKENKIKWDAISLFNVIEHITDPMNVLKISNELLKKNGIIVIEVPNYNSVSTYVQILAGVADRHLVPYSHIMMFTINSAKYALRKAGFKPLAMWMWGMDIIELLKWINKKEKKFLNSDLNRILCEKLNNLQRVLDEGELGDLFLMIGRKIK